MHLACPVLRFSPGLFERFFELPDSPFTISLRPSVVALDGTEPLSQLGEPLSTRALGDALLRETIVYLTCVHELGHAVGLNHTRNFEDIMYSFAYGGDFVAYFMRYRSRLQTRQDIAKFSGLSGHDIEILHSLYAK